MWISLTILTMFLILERGCQGASEVPKNQEEVLTCLETCYPHDCADLASQGKKADGVYLIYPGGKHSNPVPVYCDMSTKDGPWTVFQKRFDGKVSFYRGWKEYKAGFGRVDGEYWLGLQNIYLLTLKKSYRLRITLVDWDDVERFVTYEDFALSRLAVDPEEDGYKLYLEGFKEGDPTKPAVNSCRINSTCFPLDCKDVYDSKFTSNGVYWIFPKGCSSPVQVYCDMTTRNGPWTVFQKRFDGSENFYRGYQDYKAGFGRADSEYWLGLENLHRITSQRYYRLRIDITDFDNDSRFVYYNNFSLSGEIDSYRLYMVDFQEGNLCKPIGNSFGTAHGMGFTTYDHDRDLISGNCATTFKGGSWYRNCLGANPNGLYLRGPTNQYGTGMIWKTWRGDYYSMKITELKIALK